MTKIMLVEDDKSLREIYSIRLVAEGYEIVSASDGEEALALAVKERPDLILSDVMMPKISGFDMLDILRSTPETKDIKVIMMTALSSEDQRQRGESLGADRYLVKSQVGIEDVINVVHEVLGDGKSTAPATGGAQPEKMTSGHPSPAVSAMNASAASPAAPAASSTSPDASSASSTAPSAPSASPAPSSSQSPTAMPPAPTPYSPTPQPSTQGVVNSTTPQPSTESVVNPTTVHTPPAQTPPAQASPAQTSPLSKANDQA